MSKKKEAKQAKEHVSKTVEHATAENLFYLAKTYDSITMSIAKTRQRLCALGADRNVKCDLPIQEMESTKGRIERMMLKELPFFPVWNQWLENVPGIGPFIAANLIILFNYRHVALCGDCGGDIEKVDKALHCKACGKDIKGDGVLQYRKEQRDFPNISKWWAYMGRHTVEGVMPKRKSGTESKNNWSSKGRVVTFLAGESFNKQGEGHLYKAFLLKRKAKQAVAHPEWSKGHIYNAACNETVKLFLAHFWTVSRTLAGLPVTEPYAGTILGHTGIIEPFYFEK